MLLREYIGRALYARSGGYFTKHVVGGLRQPLDLAAMADESDYRQHVAKMASEAAAGGSAWLTPSEVFTPWYGRAVARNIAARHRRIYAGHPLQIIEIGGGNATHAVDVLDHLRTHEPDLFETCRYTLVDISQRLADIQRAELAAAGFAIERGRFEVHHGCASDWAAERASLDARLQGPWHIAMLEVLDNLPHDKIRVRSSPTGDGDVFEEGDSPHPQRSFFCSLALP